MGLNLSITYKQNITYWLNYYILLHKNNFKEHILQMFKKIDNASAFKLKRIAKQTETKQHKLLCNFLIKTKAYLRDSNYKLNSTQNLCN